MKWSKLFMSGILLALSVACSDGGSDDKDDVLDMSDVINRELYYNKWLNNKDAYTKEGMVDVIRLGGDGKIWEIDFGGKSEKLLGTWKENTSENQLRISYENGDNETWHVLSWEKGVFTVMVNKGKREYIAEDNKQAAYLKDITGDAFLLTEITQQESKTTLRVMLEGKNTPDINEAKVILSQDEFMELKYAGNKIMTEREDIDAGILNLPGRERDVIFYVNMGKGKEFKFADHVYATGLGAEDYDSFDLHASNNSNEVTVRWKNPYLTNDAYYQIEVLTEDEKTTYFKSDYLAKGTSTMVINNTTKVMDGYTNNIRDLIGKGTGAKYVVRLSVVLLEPGIDVNSECSYVNRQAVTRVKVLQVMN